MLGRVRDVIVATHHMRNPHRHIIGDDREVIGRVAVGAQDDEVFDVRVVETDRAADQVFEARGARWHQKADGARTLLLLVA